MATLIFFKGKQKGAINYSKILPPYLKHHNEPESYTITETFLNKSLKLFNAIRTASNNSLQ